MKLAIRPKPRPTGEDDPAVIETVASIVMAGTPVTASAIAKKLHMCQIAVSRIIWKRFGLNLPGPPHLRSVRTEWAPVNGDPGRLQETLYIYREEVVVEED